uniref:Uncharacterized protein n=1 Tax=Arundo donax TaxID=35708 RepID=A0A0A8ZSK8_ARUDO
MLSVIYFVCIVLSMGIVTDNKLYFFRILLL